MYMDNRCKKAERLYLCLPCPVRCANIHKYQQFFNRSGIWANRNLPSFSVGSVRARSVFSVESAEFDSVAIMMLRSKNSYQRARRILMVSGLIASRPHYHYNNNLLIKTCIESINA